MKTITITIKCPNCSSIDLEIISPKRFKIRPIGFLLSYKCDNCKLSFDLHVKYEATGQEE